jgi:hypothetical protein
MAVQSDAGSARASAPANVPQLRREDRSAGGVAGEQWEKLLEHLVLEDVVLPDHCAGDEILPR